MTDLERLQDSISLEEQLADFMADGKMFALEKKLETDAFDSGDTCKGKEITPESSSGEESSKISKKEAQDDEAARLIVTLAKKARNVKKNKTFGSGTVIGKKPSHLESTTSIKAEMNPGFQTAQNRHTEKLY